MAHLPAKFVPKNAGLFRPDEAVLDNIVSLSRAAVRRESISLTQSRTVGTKIVISTGLAFALTGGDPFLLISEEKIANIFNGLEQGCRIPWFVWFFL
jgi:hypothetical protein